jgi:hypothetical protein
VRLLLVRLFFCLLVGAASLLAQVPRIGILDFYGLRKVTEARIRETAVLQEGDRLPASKGDVEDRIETIPGVVTARLQAICCASGKAILYIGIEERGASHFDFHPPPKGDVTLPAEIADNYRSFVGAFTEAARIGQTGEDTSRGYALASDPTARSYQEKFVSLANGNYGRLHETLRESSDPEQRAIAAYLIGYAQPTRSVVDDLQYAMQDSDESVRANATRALASIATFALKNPDSNIRVEPTWFIEMLNSLVWSDRYHAATALVTITEGRDPGALDQLRERALPSLLEMARWKTLSHALPAFMLLGRVAGIPEAQIQAAWSRGDRESILQRVATPRKH